MSEFCHIDRPEPVSIQQCRENKMVEVAYGGRCPCCSIHCPSWCSCLLPPVSSISWRPVCDPAAPYANNIETVQKHNNVISASIIHTMVRVLNQTRLSCVA